MKQEIYCSVNSCYYWDPGNHCKADKILVTADSMAVQKPDNWDAFQASAAPGTPVNNAMETCCKSFVEKNSENIHADGVHRMS